MASKASSKPQRPSGERLPLLVDTNAVIDVTKGRRNVADIAGGFISSVVLHELFGVYAPGGWDYQYYPRPLPTPYLELKRLKRRAGDGIGFAGAGPFPPHPMRTHGTTTRLVNFWGPGALAHQASIVVPERRVSFRDAADTLTQARITALPLTQNIVESAGDIVEQFGLGYEGKQDRRNSFNDLLILSHARWAGLRVVSSDKILSAVASEMLGWNCVKDNSEEWYSITSPVAVEMDVAAKAQKQTYINVQWRSVRWFDQRR